MTSVDERFQGEVLKTDNDAKAPLRDKMLHEQHSRLYSHM
jgi:hypothetical protein